MIEMSAGKNILKILVGIVLMVVGVAWYFVNVPILPGLIAGISEQSHPLYLELLVVFAGFFGLFLLFVGLIVAWMGYDDYQMEKEMEKEEEEIESREEESETGEEGSEEETSGE